MSPARSNQVGLHATDARALTDGSRGYSSALASEAPAFAITPLSAESGASHRWSRQDQGAIG
jgi:hypothetical protein